MSPHTIHNHKPRSEGFTLIELLTVVSIIGLLSSIILASLNSAKKKAQDAAIIADLRGFIAEAELLRLSGIDYSGVNDLTFAAKIKEGITKISGATAVYCFSAGDTSFVYSGYDHSGESNLRWACSATNSDKSKIWTVSSESNRVVTWDNPAGLSNWQNAINNCINSGARLPTLEELYTARIAVGYYSSTATASFVSNDYWSSTVYAPPGPSNAWNIYWNPSPSNDVYTSYDPKSVDYFNARCVR